MSTDSEEGLPHTVYMVLLLIAFISACCRLCSICCPLRCCRGGCGMKRKGYVIQDAVPSQPMIHPGMEGNQSVVISDSFPEKSSQYSSQVMEGNQSVAINGSFPSQPSEYSLQVMEGNQSVVISGSFPAQPSLYSPQVMQHNPPEAYPHYEMLAKY